MGYVKQSIHRVFGFLEEPAEVVWADNDTMSSPVDEEQRRVLRLETFGVIQEDLGDELKSNDGVCAVCLSEFAMDEKVLLLTKCCHVYHETCLTKWLDVQQKSCPLCRSPLITD
uniref:RING-type domain-containing protein n=1 Tax=Picea sitchensis TaxID=3332 RepID=A9NXE5_PICSI|nr:unknown [Picea sitchensis]